ncbi:uncharacterized protein [Henckelia pumila]|uniref:uncharacterized protein n=1 Tax=Henckelia pumila TaxID=405737 RepID=UPI003C6E43CB
MRFGLKGKLSTRYIGPFEILEKIGDATYLLALPPYLSGIHNAFHVSLLQQYIDELHVIYPSDVQLEPDLSYVERLHNILDRKDKVLKNKRIPLVMVKLQRRGIEEATWKLESQMQTEYPSCLLYILSICMECIVSFDEINLSVLV